MLFNSFSYMIFLPIVFGLYWLVPQKFRWILILVASYFFYMNWSIKYVCLIMFTTVTSYCSGILIFKTNSIKKKKAVLLFSVIVCLAVLFFFKYFNFLSDNISVALLLFGIRTTPIRFNIMLPVGISFYTFQTLGYIIDIYRGKVTPEKNLGIYAAFISFFPQLVAGPIERTTNLLPQIKNYKCFDERKAIDGMKLMLWGYYKKLVIADNVSGYVNNCFANISEYKGIDLIICMFFFSIQIYCDFSGYSDIAIGTAKLFNIDLMTNFKSPYFSFSIKEFWSRWHISLSLWFRDYFYIPLGGNRCSRWRNALNVFLTFLASGMWHGANWTFIVWGAVHGIAQIVEKRFEQTLIVVRKNKLGKIVSVAFVFCYCSMAWVFFRADSLSDAVCFYKKLFNSAASHDLFSDITMISHTDLLLCLIYILILAVYDYVHRNSMIRLFKSTKMQWGLYICLGVIIAFCAKKGVPAEFVYFQF